MLSLTGLVNGTQLQRPLQHEPQRPLVVSSATARLHLPLPLQRVLAKHEDAIRLRQAQGVSISTKTGDGEPSQRPRHNPDSSTIGTVVQGQSASTDLQALGNMCDTTGWRDVLQPSVAHATAGRQTRSTAVQQLIIQPLHANHTEGSSPSSRSYSPSFAPAPAPALQLSRCRPFPATLPVWARTPAAGARGTMHAHVSHASNAGAAVLHPGATHHTAGQPASAPAPGPWQLATAAAPLSNVVASRSLPSWCQKGQTLPTHRNREAQTTPTDLQPGPGPRGQHEGAAAGMSPVPQVPAPPPTPTLGIQAYDMLGFKLELARMQDASTPRTGFSLSVTDLTAAEWCALQTAYQTATGRRKAATASMTQGSNIHEQLEREVIVDQVDVEVDSAEDELALQLLNAVAAIRQLVLEGLTRELRMFAKIRGQWLVGVIDQLELTEEGKVSMTETKTRRKKEKPPAEQVTTARLQVCMYQVMYDSFRSLTLPQLHEYLFRVSTSHVGLDPQRALGPSLAAHMALLLADQQAQPPRSPGSTQAQSGQPADPPAPAPALDMAETAATALPALMSGPAQAALNTAQPPAVPVYQGVDLPNPSQHAQPAAASSQSGSEQASDHGRVSLQTPSPSSPEAPSQGDVAGGLAAQAAAPPITLADAIQLLHDSLRLLPPPGTHHKLEYLWQEDRFERLKDEEVEFDGQWLEERLEAALDLWQGRAEPQAAPRGSFKCKFCDFRPQCKVYVPSHPLAEPVALARQTLEERRQAARSRQAAEAVEVAATVLAPT